VSDQDRPSAQFVAGRVEYFAADAVEVQTFEDLMALLAKANKPPLIRQMELIGCDSGGRFFKAMLDFNSFTADFAPGRTAEFCPPRYDKYLGEILVEDGVITDEQLAEAVTTHQLVAETERFGATLVRLGFATASQILDAVCKQYGLSKW